MTVTLNNLIDWVQNAPSGPNAPQRYIAAQVFDSISNSLYHGTVSYIPPFYVVVNRTRIPFGGYAFRGNAIHSRPDPNNPARPPSPPDDPGFFGGELHDRVDISIGLQELTVGLHYHMAGSPDDFVVEFTATSALEQDSVVFVGEAQNRVFVVQLSMGEFIPPS